jgi:peptide/nickel transport system permease protein
LRCSWSGGCWGSPSWCGWSPWRHPALASIGAGVGILFGSAAIVDQVFALGGIGQELLTSVQDGDLMVVMGTVLLAVILISLVNLAVDICLAFLDPRVRLT